jgi:hypothetical protein
VDVLRVLLIVLHIIFAGVWIAQFAAEIGFGLALRGSEGKAVELPLLMARTRVLGFMGQVGGIGILFTGFGLLWVTGLPFLGIGGFTPTWLLIKQIVFLIAMVIVFIVLTPMQRRLVPQFVQAAKGTPTVTADIRALVSQMTSVSRLINLIVLVNIILGVWKPG